MSLLLRNLCLGAIPSLTCRAMGKAKGRKKRLLGNIVPWGQLQWRNARHWNLEADNFTYWTSQKRLFWASIWYYAGRQAPPLFFNFFSQNHFLHSLHRKTGVKIFCPWWNTLGKEEGFSYTISSILTNWPPSIYLSI